MAIFGKDRNERKGTADGPFPATGPAPVEADMFEREHRGRGDAADMSGTNAFLGKGTRVTGKLTFEGPVRIEGQVEGEIIARDTLTIGEGADVKAQITGNGIVIHGRVTGAVKANKRLEIQAPGRLVGNISAPVVVIHEGVVFEGQCSMGAAEGARTEKDGKVTHLPTAETAKVEAK
jgi:cytoskeletal protein CcmA (bactofilin family)